MKGDPVRAITSENASSDSRRGLPVETASDLPCLRELFQPDPLGLPMTETPLAVWRDYNGRADCENVIKELQQGFALPTLCLHSFWATEAALSLATLTYNLTVLFQRHLGWQTRLQSIPCDFGCSLRPESSPILRARPPSRSPCHVANAIGGHAFGIKSSARFPTAMQSKTGPLSAPELCLKLNSYCMVPAKGWHRD